MAEYTAAFDINAALEGAENIWTRSGLPVIFGAYNEEATDPLEEVQVWVDGQPADYPVDGRANGNIDDPLDLLMVTEDETKYIAIFNIGTVPILYTLTYPLFDTLVEAQALSTMDAYNQAIPINIIVPKNIP